MLHRAYAVNHGPREHAAQFAMGVQGLEALDPPLPATEPSSSSD
jgi:hypothetical protein